MEIASREGQPRSLRLIARLAYVCRATAVFKRYGQRQGNPDRLNRQLGDSDVGCLRQLRRLRFPKRHLHQKGCNEPNNERSWFFAQAR